jgi:hypothetical protein
MPARGGEKVDCDRRATKEAKMEKSWTKIGLSALTIFASVATASPLFAHGGDSNVIHACVSNFLKVVRIVRPNEGCHYRLESPLHWSITGPAGPQGPQGLQGPPGAADNGGPANGFVVKDSLDQVIGKSDGIGIIRAIGPDTLYFRVRPSGFSQSFIQFAYTTDNCQGTRYLSMGAGLSQMVLTTDGVTGYYPSGPGQQLTMRSFQNVFAGQPVPTQGESCLVQETTSNYGEAAAIDLATVGVPPFRLE